MTSVRKAGRPPKALRRYKRNASKSDYEKMANAAASVVMQNRGMQWRTGDPEYVLMTFPFWIKFSSTFPKGFIVEKTAETNTYKVNAKRLLDWLYDNGHAPYNCSMLIAQTKEFERLEKSIERMLKGEENE